MPKSCRAGKQIKDEGRRNWRNFTRLNPDGSEPIAYLWERTERRIPPYLYVDEKAFAQRHRYETVICDAQRGTVEYVVEDRRQESLEASYRQFSAEELAQGRGVAMDRWDPYVAATQAWVAGAGDRIVFNKFHVLRTVNKAMDKVRRQEHKRLKGAQHLGLANEENVPEWRRAEF